MQAEWLRLSFEPGQKGKQRPHNDLTYKTNKRIGSVAGLKEALTEQSLNFSRFNQTIQYMNYVSWDTTTSHMPLRVVLNKDNGSLKPHGINIISTAFLLRQQKKFNALKLSAHMWIVALFRCATLCAIWFNWKAPVYFQYLAYVFIPLHTMVFMVY